MNLINKLKVKTHDEIHYNMYISSNICSRYKEWNTDRYFTKGARIINIHLSHKYIRISNWVQNAPWGVMSLSGMPELHL